MKAHSGILQRLVQQAEFSKSMAFVVGKHAEFIHYNHVWLDYRNTSLGEECAKNPHTFIHADDVDIFLSSLVDAGQHKEPFLAECRLRDTTGAYVWFEFIVNPVYSSKGTFVACIAYGHESTQKKLVEEKARRYIAVIASIETGIIIKDKEGKIIDWSAGAQNIMGFTLEDVRGETSDIYTYSPNLKAIEEVNKLVAQGEHTAFIKTEVNHKDGHLIICSTSFSPLWGHNGGMDGSLVIFHDVTAEKRAEEKRLTIEAEFRKSQLDTAVILNEIPAPLCVVSEKGGTILGCNVAFADMCSSREADLLEHAMTDYFQGGDELSVDSAEYFLNKLRTNASFICRLKKNDGSIVNVEIMGRPFSFNEQSAFAVHCIDLTKRQIQEQALRETVLAAEEASKMKSTFLANMSHEIRTPLNGVIGFAELALDEPDLSKTVKAYLDKIKISANGLLEIINDVLDISKIEAGKIELEKAPFDLHIDILQTCEAIIGAKAREKNVVLYLYSEPLVAKKFIGDQTRLRQILLNLLSNAVKFTNVGIVKLMLDVEETNADTSTVFFEIKDSGIGMTPGQIQKIFEPFSQADSSTTRKYGGTGLGLTITKNLIELMGGKLHVESAVGIGSKFYFSLPMETIVDTSVLSRPSVSLPVHRNKPLFKGEVLVCEDNVINQQVIQEHLAKVGLDVVTMPNGKLGLEQVKERVNTGHPFDLILMDIHMPVMDGLEATTKLHELGVKTAIIALTANAMSTDRKKYLNHGMSDYLAKPFKAHELWDCLLRNLVPVGQESSVEKIAVEKASAVPVVEKASVEKASAVPGVEKKRPVENSVAAVPPLSVPPVPVAVLPCVFIPSVIDQNLGIENSAGDPELYQRLLTNFLEDNRDFCATFNAALASGNITLAHRMAHTLKSVAGTIGAMALSPIACDIEKALAVKQLNIVNQKMPSLITALNAVLKELSFVESRCEGLAPLGDLNREKALELIQKLQPLLRKADLESLDYLDAIATILFPVGEKGKALADQIDDYDFELALTTLGEIKTYLETKYE